MMHSVRSNPFPGLRPFEAGEEHLFFGREAQLDYLLGRLRRNRFLAVVGASGSGKSSLVRAGLLPALHGGFMAGTGSRWKIAVMRPGIEPIANLARALVDAGVAGGDDEAQDLQVGLTRTVLERGELGLVEAVKQSRLEPGENLLILVDQFEELFRFANAGDARRNAEEAASFVRLLLAAAWDVYRPIYVVLTMRSDAIGECAQFRDLPETINEGLFLVPRMTREELQRAIVGPIGVAGGEIAPRLVSRLLNGLNDDPDQLPLLQHALMRSWTLRDTADGSALPLDVEHLDAAGGLGDALSRHADEIYASLRDDRDREIAERLFKCITDPGPDNRGMRRPLRFREARNVIGCFPEELQLVVDAFRAPGRSFLMPPYGTPLTDNTVLDLSHESLMRAWKRLQTWVEEEAQSAAIYRRLAVAARLRARGEAALWRDPDLTLAVAWRNRTKPNAAWAARYDRDFEPAMAFLAASEAARDAELGEQTRARRRYESSLRAFIAALAVLLVVAAAVAVTSYVQKNAADRMRAAAEQQRATADAQAAAARRQALRATTETRIANVRVARALQAPARSARTAGRPQSATRADAHCDVALGDEKRAAGENVPRRAEYDAVAAGLAANARCGDPDMRLINEAYLLSLRAQAAHDLGVGDWRADLRRANGLLSECASSRHLGAATVAGDCRLQRSYNERLANAYETPGSNPTP